MNPPPVVGRTLSASNKNIVSFSSILPHTAWLSESGGLSEYTVQVQAQVDLANKHGGCYVYAYYLWWNLCHSMQLVQEEPAKHWQRWSHVQFSATRRFRACSWTSTSLFKNIYYEWVVLYAHRPYCQCTITDTPSNLWVHRAVLSLLTRKRGGCGRKGSWNETGRVGNKTFVFLYQKH